MEKNIEKQEIKISKQKIDEIKKNILYAYLISFAILLLNSFFLNLDISIEHSSKDYYGYSYWVTNENNENDFNGLFKFGSDSFESSWIVKIFNLDTSSLSYDTLHNFFSKIFLGNIPFIIFGNFILLTIVAIIIYFIRREYLKFRSKYTIKIEDPKKIEKQQEDEFLKKLEKAHAAGLITTEEYQRKISENNRIKEEK